jgi:hypothetical protein
VISKQLKKNKEMKVARVITSDSSDSEWGEHQALVDELRAKLHEDYDNIVLGEEIIPDPPHCTAHIFLKSGAQPKKTEPDIVARRKNRCYDWNCTELV